jgi:ribosomal protein L37E
MKTIYCWRCGENVPGFEEAEHEELLVLWKVAVKRSNIVSAFEVTRIARESPEFQAVRDRYQEITGQEMKTKCANFFHRLSEFGPPCNKCGKPLRTMKARFCAACGHERT